MTDQKPIGVFVRLPLSNEQIKAADEIAKEIAESNAENEWRFARHHFSACDELAIALGTPVVAGELPIVTTLGTLRDPVPCVRQSEAQAQIAARDAKIVRLREENEHLLNALDEIEMGIDALPDDMEDGRRMSVHEMQRQALAVVREEIKRLKGGAA